MNIKVKIKHLLFIGSFFFITTLSGCNSEDGTIPDVAKTVTLSADNAMNLISGSERFISLEDKIHASSSYGVNNIADVELLDDQSEYCKNISVEDKGYSIGTSDFVGTCTYKYIVNNSVDYTANAAAYSRVIIQKDSVNPLKPFKNIPKTLEVNQELVIDLESELEGEIPEGFTLSEGITLLGIGAVTPPIEGSQKITFISDEVGYSQILFSYQNEEEVKLGSINISISSSMNFAPYAKDVDWSESEIEDPEQEIQVGQTRKLPLSKYMIDPDDDPLQIIYASSWDATVTIIDDTTIEFTSDHVGEQFVTYAITDHNGGYDIATIRLQVIDPGEMYWSNISRDIKVYYGPLTNNRAIAQGTITTSSYFDEGTSAIVATFDYEKAVRSCENYGRLPTKEELVDLFKLHPEKEHGWPIGLPYWTDDSNELVDISESGQGKVVKPTLPTGYIVTCISGRDFSIDTSESDLEAVADGEDKASVVVRIKNEDDQPMPGQDISAFLPEGAQAIFEEDQLVTDENGEAVFHLTSEARETDRLDFVYDSYTRSATVEFVGQWEGATYEVTENLAGTLLKEEPAYLTVMLRDKWGVPIDDVPIEFRSSASVVHSPKQTTKNGKGTTLKVEWWGWHDVGEQKVRIWVDSTEVPIGGMQEEFVIFKVPE